ncbi:MAG: hypothetical protein GY756_11380, partial [bacterium]|nr:hypothetical protein [bacterium]
LPSTLTELTISSCALQKIPRGFSDNFPYLKKLNISDNSLFPKSISHIPSSVTELNIQNNKLSKITLPPENKVETLDCSNNHLEHISDIKNGTHIKHLNLSHCHLKELNSHDKIHIKKLFPDLKTITIAGYQNNVNLLIENLTTNMDQGQSITLILNGDNQTISSRG